MTNRGFGAIALLTLLPLFLTLLAGVASAFLIFRSDAKLRHQCRTRLLQAQEKVASHLQKLIALNPEARELRRQRVIADNAAFVAPLGLAGAAARAHQAFIIDMQLQLAARQRALIAKALFESRQGPARTSIALSRSTDADVAIYPKEQVARSTARTVRAGRFDVRPSPADSLTPDYEPADRFADSQTMRVQWSVTLTSLLPSWVGTWIPLNGLGLTAECSATLAKPNEKTKEKKQWLPILNAANP